MTTARERFLEALLESATDYAIISIDLDGLVTSWNEGARRILGWSEEEMVGRPASLFFTAEDCRQGIPQAEMQAALRFGRGNDERWHQCKDGACFWANGEMMPLKDEAGIVQGFLKILRDRTAQRNAADKQRADAEFLRSILAASGDRIEVLDYDGKLMVMSERGQRILGVTDFADIRDCHWPDLWGDDKPAASEALEAAKAGGTGRFQGLTRNAAQVATWWDVQVTPILGSDGRPERLLCVSRDITEFRDVAGQLALSEASLRLATDAAEIGTWDLDLTGDVLTWSDRTKAMFGISPDVPCSMDDFYAGLHPEDLAATSEAFASALDPARRATYDVEYRTIGQEDGAIRWVAAKGRGVFDAQGRCIRAIGTAIDISRRKQAEEHQRMLMQELSHRVKNTLAIVQAIALQTLRGTGTLAEAGEALTSRLLALAQAHDVLMQGSWTEASIRALVDSAARVHGRDGSGRFRIEGPDVTLGPRAALSFALVLHELGTNAVKYGALSTPDGHVAITWSRDLVDGEPHLRFRWREVGGPVVSPPPRQGFGSRLIERSFGRGQGEAVELSFPPDGVTLTLDASLSTLQQA